MAAVEEDFEDLPPHEPAWAARDRVASYRKGLLASGYLPIPVNGKRPYLDDWVNTKATDAFVDTWSVTRPDDLNTSILTRTAPAIDIDIMDEEVAEELEALAEEMLSKTVVRIGRPPKRALLFRADAPFRKLSATFTAPNGHKHLIEVLGDGQHIVVNGTHPETHQPYRWHGGEPGPKLRREDLPLLTAEAATAFLAAATELLIKRGWTLVDSKKSNGKKNGGTAGTTNHGARPASAREKTYGRAALEGSAEELAATAKPGRNAKLYAKAFHLGTMVARGWITRAEVEAALTEAMAENGYVADKGMAAVEATLASGLDDGLEVPHQDLDGEGGENTDDEFEDAAQSSAKVVIKTSKEFVAGFVPPEYVVVGLLQRRFFYSFTGQTGAGKTAIALLLSACAAIGRLFAGRETKPVRVLYLAAENADDVRMRWIAFAQNMDFDINTIEVYFVEGRFSLSQSMQALHEEAERHGGEFGLVIVDTGPTFFEGKDENENKQLGDHARVLRSLITTIPGGPCVVANCHPVKNATADQLIPRGGGAFLAEADGNLTAAKTDSTVEVHWQGKFRGPDFAPMYFLIRTVTHQDLKDSDGRLIPTVIAEYISEQAREDIAAAAKLDESAVLAFISTNTTASLAAIATAMDWKLHSGEPNKMRAGRHIKALVKAKLVKLTRAGHYQLTAAGKKELNGETEEEDE